MELFVSWSGQRSRSMALAIRTWLPEVIQEIEPFVSSEDIAKGTNWNSDLIARLDANTQGIVCLTPENQHSPWVNYEAGALAKSVGIVRPLLSGMKKTDLTGPLASFQATDIDDRADMWLLIESLNERCSKRLDESLLKRLFERSWPDFEESLNDAVLRNPPEQPAIRATEDMVSEILTLVRSMERQSSSVIQGTTESPLPWLGQVNVRPGDRVYHDTFGSGSIMQMEGTGDDAIAHVAFPKSGEKRLLLKYAPVAVYRSHTREANFTSDKPWGWKDEESPPHTDDEPTA